MASLCILRQGLIDEISMAAGKRSANTTPAGEGPRDPITPSEPGKDVPKPELCDNTADAGADPLQFEKSLNELEGLVERLETGELSLEESLRTYERGVQLSRLCQRALDSAEQRVEMLSDPMNAGIRESDTNDDR